MPPNLLDQAGEPEDTTPVAKGDPKPEGAADSAPDDEASGRPEWLPEKFWNADDAAPNVENLAKSYAELERNREVKAEELKQQWEQERLAARPEAPDQYELPEVEAFDAETFASSRVVELWRKAAHEAGLGQEQFAKVIEEYAAVETAKIEEAKAAEIAKLGENARVRLDAVSKWIDKSFSGEEQIAIKRMAVDAAGVQALEKLMGMGSIPSDNDSDPAGAQEEVTEADIRNLMNTPEYYDAKRRDPAVVRKVEDFFKRKYG